MLLFVRMILPYLRHEVSHLFCGTSLHLPRGVRVGAERKAGVIVTQHRGYCFDIYTVLQCQGCKRVSQVVEPDMIQSRVLEDTLVERHDRVGVIHFAGPAGREHPRIVRVLGVLLLQKLHGILRDGHLADGVAGFGAA